MKWKEKNNRLNLEVNFNSQTELVEFMLEVAKLSDEVNHHPDFKVTKCSHLEIELYSHEQKGITPLDFLLADKIDALVNQLGRN